MELTQARKTVLSIGPGCVQTFNQGKKARLVIDTLVQSCKHAVTENSQVGL